MYRLKIYRKGKFYFYAEWKNFRRVVTYGKNTTAHFSCALTFKYNHYFVIPDNVTITDFRNNILDKLL